jgi:hypothetical protein
VTNQAPLVHDPDRSGLWRRYLLPSGDVHAAAWRDAIQQNRLVGTCRRCGGYLRPLQPYRVQVTDWFPAECTSSTCDYETAHHGPQPTEKKTKGRP